MKLRRAGSWWNPPGVAYVEWTLFVRRLCVEIGLDFDWFCCAFGCTLQWDSRNGRALASVTLGPVGVKIEAFEPTEWYYQRLVAVS